ATGTSVRARDAAQLTRSHEPSSRAAESPPYAAVQSRPTVDLVPHRSTFFAGGTSPGFSILASRVAGPRPLRYPEVRFDARRQAVSVCLVVHRRRSPRGVGARRVEGVSHDALRDHIRAISRAPRVGESGPDHARRRLSTDGITGAMKIQRYLPGADVVVARRVGYLIPSCSRYVLYFAGS